MLTPEVFSDLLRRMEDDTLDFKRNAYDLSKGHMKYALIKDILCMANTPRDTNAYIVLGVKQFPNSTTQLVGLSHHEDEAGMQAQFEDRINPVPRFRYELISYQDKTFGVIIIPPRKIGPSVPIRDYGNSLRQNQIYFRQGSKNSVAGPEDVKRICEWIEATDSSAARNDHSLPESLEWQSFLDATYTFSPSRRYVLITNIDSSHNIPQSHLLGSVHWSYVIDLDPESEQSGLMSAVRHKVEERRNIHMVLKGDRPTLNLDRATYWTFARGLSGSRKSVVVNSWREWQQQYGNDLRDQIADVAKAASPAPITVVAVWYGQGLTDYLQSILEALLSAMGTSVDFVIVTDDPADAQPVAARFDGDLIAIPLHHLCEGIRSIFESQPAADSAEIVLPSSSGAPISLDTSDANWIAEEIELVHLGSGHLSNARGRRIARVPQGK